MRDPLGVGRVCGYMMRVRGRHWMAETLSALVEPAEASRLREGSRLDHAEASQRHAARNARNQPWTGADVSRIHFAHAASKKPLRPAASGLSNQFADDASSPHANTSTRWHVQQSGSWSSGASSGIGVAIKGLLATSARDWMGSVSMSYATRTRFRSSARGKHWK
jgi:hypothetical protein